MSSFRNISSTFELLISFFALMNHISLQFLVVQAIVFERTDIAKYLIRNYPQSVNAMDQVFIISQDAIPLNDEITRLFSNLLQKHPFGISILHFVTF